MGVLWPHHPIEAPGGDGHDSQDRGVLRLHDPRRAHKALLKADHEPITPHEARHCAISEFIVAGPDWKQISAWAGHDDVRQTWNGYGHLVPGGELQAHERLDAYLTHPHRSRPRRTTRPPLPPKTQGFWVPLPGFELCGEPVTPVSIGHPV